MLNDGRYFEISVDTLENMQTRIQALEEALRPLVLALEELHAGDCYAVRHAKKLLPEKT